jgi:dTDP-4-amino-4,6-dideoxygalactose transaminase
VKLPHLARWTDMRRRNAERYATLFRDAGIEREVVLPIEPNGFTHIFNQYVVRLPRRDAIRHELAAAGIGTEIYYPVPFHRQECFAALGYSPGSFPVAEQAASTSLALPIYSELSAEQQEAVVGVIAGALGR